MPLTQEQLAERRKHVGASDVPAILGLSPFRNAYDVWLDKTGQLPDGAESDAAHAGNRFEAAVLDEAEERLGALVRNVQMAAPDGLPIVATLDAMLRDSHEPVEAKTSGLFGPLSGEWGEEHTDEIPEAYIVQVQVQMLCANANLAHVAAFLGGRGFAFYRVHRNRDLAQIIVERIMDFWTNHVGKGVPPADVAPSYDVIRLARRVPESTAYIDPAIYAECQAAIEARKIAEQNEEMAKAKLLAAMGSAEAGVAGALGGVTFLEQSRSSIDAKRLQAEQPDLYRQYVRSSTYRVLRFTKPKKGKV